MNEESSSSFLDMLEDLVYEYLCKYDGKDEWPNTDGDRQTSQAYDGEEEEDAPDLVDGHDSGDGWW